MDEATVIFFIAFVWMAVCQQIFMPRAGRTAGADSGVSFASRHSDDTETGTDYSCDLIHSANYANLPNNLYHSSLGSDITHSDITSAGSNYVD